MTREEKSWILYDVANSAFVLILITAIMPIFFKEFAADGLSNSRSTALWGYSNSAAALIVALLAPVLGALADYEGKKIIFFRFFLVTGIIATFSILFVTRGNWVFCIVVFIIARLAWSGANIFYDSFLTDVTTDERMDLISARGYAWGYIGSVVPFVAVIGIILHGGTSQVSPIHYKIGFAITALWWFFFSIPMLKRVKQKNFIPAEEKPFTQSMKRLWSNISSWRENRNIYLFLLAYFLYIDGVDTVITMAAAYGIDSGLGTITLISAILLIQILAFPCALIYGRLAVKFSAKFMITAGIGVYTIITFIAFFLPGIQSQSSKIIVFFALSVLVASSMGGIQALSRSFYGKIIPPERSAEFFGMYNIFGKFAAIMGPLMMAVTTDLTGSSKYGILCILFLFISGGFLLQKVTPAVEHKNA